MYADDSSFFVSGQFPDVLIQNANIDLAAIKDWLDANKLSLNTSKSKFMFFLPASKHLKISINLSINNEIIEQVHSYKFLGFTLDKHLKWDIHISTISQKLSKNIGILQKLRGIVDFQTLIKLYYSFIHAYLVNGLTTWGSTNITTLNHLTLLQKRAVRVITNSKKLDHTGPLFIKCNILAFKKLCQYAVCTHMFKAHHGILPFILANMFTKRFVISTRATRQSHHFHVPLVLRTQSKNGIYFSGPVLFNKLCADMDLNISIHSFKRLVKKTSLPHNYLATILLV